MDEEIDELGLLSLLTPLEHMEFSVRAANCLKAAGLKTVADVVAGCSWERLSKIPNVGKLTIIEVQDEMIRHLLFVLQRARKSNGYVLARADMMALKASMLSIAGQIDQRWPE